MSHDTRLAADALDRPPPLDVIAALVRDNCPDLAGEQIRWSEDSGSSNWVARVGRGAAVRLPRTQGYADDLRKELDWLPYLTQHVGTPIPRVVHAGEPAEGVAFPWAVMTWVPGETPGDLGPQTQERLAADLGRFVAELHAVPVEGQEAGARQWGYRAGEPVTADSDAWVEQCADELAGMFDPRSVRLAWERLRAVPPASEPPCWVHTDLSAENLLVGADGALRGVIDFGGLGVGDRSVDLLYAWSLFDRPAREVFRAAAGVDDVTWVRGRAWCFAGPGLLTIAHYRHTLPERTRRLTRMVEAAAADVGVDLR